MEQERQYKATDSKRIKVTKALNRMDPVVMSLFRWSVVISSRRRVLPKSCQKF